MEGLNKLISLFLGLVVVIIVFGIITGRINLKNRLPAIGKKTEKTTSTPTPTKEQTRIKISSETTTQTNLYQKPTLTIAPKYVSSIPQTGAPTVILPLALAGLFSGFYLKKKAE